MASELSSHATFRVLQFPYYLQIRAGTDAPDYSAPDFSSYQELLFIPGPQSNPNTWKEVFLQSPFCARYISVQRMATTGCPVLEVTELEVLSSLDAIP